jgi:hypothetical protein
MNIWMALKSVGLMSIIYAKWETVYVDKEEPKGTESHKNRDKFYGHFEEIKDLFWTEPEYSKAITDAMANL